MLIIIQWVGGAVVGGALGLATRMMTTMYRRRRRQSRQLRQYLALLAHSESHPGNSPLGELYLHYNLDQYIEPSILVSSDSSIAPARRYLLDRIDNTSDLRVLVDGIFGCGKTALCLDLARHIAKTSLSRPRRSRIVPIVMSLTGLKVELEDTLSESLNDLIVTCGLDSFESFSLLRRLVSVVLILDGLDQMLVAASPYMRANTLWRIHRIAAPVEGPKRPVRLLLTSRSDFLGQPGSPLDLALQGSLKSDPTARVVEVPPFERVTLQGLTDQQLLRYLEARRDLSATPAQVLERLQSNLHVSEWMRHPLLLSMFLTLTAKDVLGPDLLNVAELYARYSAYWFEHDSRLMRLGSMARRKKFVQELALSIFFAEPEQSVHLDDIHGLRSPESNWTALRQVMLDPGVAYLDATTRSFLLVNSDETIMFSHRSFAEYFVADLVLQEFRANGCIDDNVLERVYTNLVVSFMRYAIRDSDSTWVQHLTRRSNVYARCLGYALLPLVANGREGQIVTSLRSAFLRETDMDTRRHMLYGIGWLGENPLTPEVAAALEASRTEWLASALRYYRTTQQQRLHCVHRLRTYAAGDKALYSNRGLYIFDLGDVGTSEDIALIAPYADPAHETAPIVLSFAVDAISRIRTRQEGVVVP